MSKELNFDRETEKRENKDKALSELQLFVKKLAEEVEAINIKIEKMVTEFDEYLNNK